MPIKPFLNWTTTTICADIRSLHNSLEKLATVNF